MRFNRSFKRCLARAGSKAEEREVLIPLRFLVAEKTRVPGFCLSDIIRGTFEASSARHRSSRSARSRPFGL